MSEPDTDEPTLAPSVLIPTWQERLLFEVQAQGERLRKIEAEQTRQTAEVGTIADAMLDSQPVRERQAKLALEADEWSGEKRDRMRALLMFPTTRAGGVSCVLLAAALAGYFGLDVPATIRAWECQPGAEAP